jgi:hypothetical protein
MNRFLALMVLLLMVADGITLSSVQRLSHRPAPPDLTPRVEQLEKDLSQAQSDIGEMKQELIMINSRGRAAD